VSTSSTSPSTSMPTRRTSSVGSSSASSRCETVFGDPESFFHNYATLPDDGRSNSLGSVATINGVNLRGDPADQSPSATVLEGPGSSGPVGAPQAIADRRSTKAATITGQGQHRGATGVRARRYCPSAPARVRRVQPSSWSRRWPSSGWWPSWSACPSGGRRGCRRRRRPCGGTTSPCSTTRCRGRHAQRPGVGGPGVEDQCPEDPVAEDPPTVWWYLTPPSRSCRRRDRRA
jgi:hypothetical protein